MWKDVGFHLYATVGRALKKRTFFRARSAPVTGIDVHTTYPNLAKYTQHHKMFAKIANYGTACYVFIP